MLWLADESVEPPWFCPGSVPPEWRGCVLTNRRPPLALRGRHDCCRLARYYYVFFLTFFTLVRNMCMAHQFNYAFRMGKKKHNTMGVIAACWWFRDYYNSIQ